MLYLTDAQKAQLVDNEPTLEVLEAYWRFYPDLNFDAAIGGAIDRSKVGWFRTEAVEAPGKPSADFTAAVTEPAKEEPKPEEPKAEGEPAPADPACPPEEPKVDPES